MKYPIYIATKGRASRKLALTLVALENEGLKYTLFVQPSEVELYQTEFPGAKIVAHEKDNRGVALDRQTLLDYARKNNIERYWQLDDDITGVIRQYRDDSDKVIKLPSNWKDSLTFLESLIDRLPDLDIAQISMNSVYASYWDAGSIKLNSSNGQVVLMRTDTGSNYDEQFRIKEDLDITLQNLTKGYECMLSNYYVVNLPSAGSNEGGLKTTYKEGELLHKVASERIVAKHPHCTTLNLSRVDNPKRIAAGKPNHWNVRVKWASFRKPNVPIQLTQEDINRYEKMM